MADTYNRGMSNEANTTAIDRAYDLGIEASYKHYTECESLVRYENLVKRARTVVESDEEMKAWLAGWTDEERDLENSGKIR